ncbi:MAG: electron transfer flavoprotein subunit alpha [Clostridia bacterium]|nr:electron transfer flavoprotein subunit alpha [Clostridia bacterium]
MASIAILERKCTKCGACINACPFGAIEIANGKPEINAGCRVCSVCVKACPESAIIKLETRAKSVDKSKWNGIMVFAEVTGGKLHPVSLELLGKAKELKGGTHHEITAVLVGENLSEHASLLRYYGAERIFVYDDKELSYFRAEAFADQIADAIKFAKPSVVLVGATALGRSLAPRLATRFHTGLTADCTKLEMRENSDLVQIRPAFGGNIMAQIITTNTRPQFATVRYKVMNAPEKTDAPSGEIVTRKTVKISSPVRFISQSPVLKSANISDAEIIVAAGRALRKESDLNMIKELASLLGGEWATSRPLVEKGWNTNARQIGLSGRTVKPRLLIACGISGAIQFTASMKDSDHIIAINSDPEAPIFKCAHIGIVGDIYEIVPELIRKIKEARGI